MKTPAHIRASNLAYKQRNKVRVDAANKAYRAREREAIRERDKKFRVTHQGYVKEYAKRYYQTSQQEKIQFLRLIKQQPCTDCGQCYPYYVMDFDHVAGEKVAGVGEMRLYSWDKLFAEVLKCEVVCANCHRERTHGKKLERVSQER